MITCRAADGSEIRAFDEGHGPVVLVVHPGLDDGTSWGKVAARLSDRFRVVRIVRRHYRVDLPPLSPYSVDLEASDILALAEAIGEPMVVVGHSSGGVVALEALTAGAPAVAGAVLYEPPVAISPAVEGDGSDRARAAAAAGKPGKAMQIFVRDVVGMRAADGWGARLMTSVVPRFRALGPRQITDLDGVGVRLPAYAQIGIPVLLLGGERSPAHLGERIAALAAVLPRAEQAVLPGVDHTAHLKAPDDVARVISDFAARVLG